MKTTTHDQLKSIIQNLIDTMAESGKWIKPWKNTLPFNHATNRAYSGFNVWILWSIATERNYSTNGWLTFNQVVALGEKVKSGEKATPVFFFKPVQIEEEVNGEIETKTIPVLKSFYVFNIDQTSITVETVQHETRGDVEAFLGSLDIEIKEDTFAYYQPKGHFIGMPKRNAFNSIEGYYSTLFHELGHSTGNALGRDLSGVFGSPSYQREELVAETTKAFLSAHFELEDVESVEFKQSAFYLKSWLKGSDPKDLFKVFSDAQKAFELLISGEKGKMVA